MFHGKSGANTPPGGPHCSALCSFKKNFVFVTEGQYLNCYSIRSYAPLSVTYHSSTLFKKLFDVSYQCLIEIDAVFL